MLDILSKVSFDFLYLLDISSFGCGTMMKTGCGSANVVSPVGSSDVEVNVCY